MFCLVNFLQLASFDVLLEQLEETSKAEIKEILEQREKVELDSELSLDVIERLQERIEKAISTKKLN
ncbi:hypothetical protein [Chroococcus sp. FPU101]|uniref:hypothetical protein n=1 Tax=Chroococcus sp. FPU101 TaxID=1974212 RepID=UPI001A8C8D08|nr:hypothetical protein [Chroococcus sp. FPU101]